MDDKQQRRSHFSVTVISVGLALQLAATIGLLVVPSHSHSRHDHATNAPTEPLSSRLFTRVHDEPTGLGLVGPYKPSEFHAMHSVGITQTLVEMSWADAEPSPGVFSRTYFTGIESQIDQLRAAGFSVALNTGMADAPNWVLATPGARFVDQFGETYTQTPEPNLVFDTALRPIAQHYLDEVLAKLGTHFSFVRAGGGYEGELTYPSVRDSDGQLLNRYWAYDINAAASDPVPTWRPGDPSPEHQAARFLGWYFNELAQFQNWQISALRQAGYRGWVAMLYPSYGLRPGDFALAVADNLDGSSSAEINGEVQRGHDPALEINKLTDPKVIVYGTWGEQLSVVQYLAKLAAEHHRPVMAENTGDNTRAQLIAALQNAKTCNLNGFFLVRAPELFGTAGELSDIKSAAER